MRLINVTLSKVFFITFEYFLDKIIIPENIAIRLANKSEVSAETFFADFIKQLYKLQYEYTDDHTKLNRSGLNNLLNSLSNQMQSDQPKKVSKKLRKNKKYQDDEDFNMDLESSGDKMSVVTTVYPTPTPDPSSDLNDTTIIFDQDPE
jgi:hypothetical protein